MADIAFAGWFMEKTLLVKRLQLGLLHVAVAMTLVPIQSTLNRVMIKELALSAALVAGLASLPYLFSPIQVAIGSFSDRHPLFGWRRTPYIALGLLLCAAGVVASPHAAYVLAAHPGAGFALCVLAFGAWGMGFNFASVSYLALASELSGEKGRSRTIAIMFFMMILGIIVTAISLSNLVDPYTPERLTRAFTWVGGAALALGGLGLVGLEPRSAVGARPSAESLSWAAITRGLMGNRQARLFFIYLILMLAALLGQDVLLEPFAAQAFGMTVKATTRITSLWGAGTLICLLIAGLLEGRVNKRTVVRVGGWGAALAFGLIVTSGVLSSASLFYVGVAALGLATGLATVSNLSLMLDMTAPGEVGLFIGAWGMANALARLTGNLLGGVLRDAVTQWTRDPVAGYVLVFGLEAAMLVASLFLLRAINVTAFRAHTETPSVVERLALAADA